MHSDDSYGKSCKNVSGLLAISENTANSNNREVALRRESYLVCVVPSPTDHTGIAQNFDI